MRISTSEDKKSSQLIKQLSPSEAQYKKYQTEAQKFVQDFAGKKRAYGATDIFSVKMIPSKIFGKNYLAAFVSGSWFGSATGEHFNAAASMSLLTMGLSSPPLVVIPGKSIPKTRGFSSIVEHEFVHVNQGIKDQFPNLNTCKLTVTNLFRELVDLTRAEFEANFIQLAHDPSLLPDPEHGIGFEEWCLLRGFAPGLETAIWRMVTESMLLADEKKFFGVIQRQLKEAFGERGLSERIGQEFADDLERMSKIAMLALNDRDPSLRQNKNFIALMRWISEMR